MKKKYTKNELDNILADDLFGPDPSSGLELGKAIERISLEFDEIVSLRAGEFNLMDWVEKHRILYGKPFSYTNAEVAMMLGEKDHQLEIAPRPYIEKYLNDRILDKTVLKCRQCLTENNYIYVPGSSNLTIKEIVERDYRGIVYTYSRNSDELLRDEIISSWKGEVKECIRISIADGFFIECSLDHKIKRENGRWIKAKDIKLGDHLLTFAENYRKVTEIINIGLQQTYDIAVKNKKRHSFLANGIVVSNSEFTENEINENIYLCSTNPYFRVVHLFPTAGMGDKISREKLTPAINLSPDIKKMLAANVSQSLRSKSFENGSFYTVESSFTDVGGRGPSCDKITFDEYESQNPAVEEVYSESTSHSKYGRRTRISTPLVPGMGVDKKYMEACQFVWLIKCPKCHKEQEMTFPENIMNYFEKDSADENSPEYMVKLNKAYIGCKHCGQYLDRTSEYYTQNSRWVAKSPHMLGLKHSYKVSYMMLPWKTGKEILYKFHEFRFVHQFYNEIIGIAYLAPDSNIGRGVLEANINRKIKNVCQYFGWYKEVVLGVDWGAGKIGSWIVVRAKGHPDSNKPSQIIYVERITNESLKRLGYQNYTDDGHKKRVEDLIKIFHVKACFNDANGMGNDRNVYLIKKFPGITWGVFYDTAENTRKDLRSKLLEPVFQKSQSRVTVSRLNEHKLAMREFSDLNKVDVPLMDSDVNEFITHLDNIVVEKMYDSLKMKEYEIIVNKGPDHYAHANVYAKLAQEWLSKQIKDVCWGTVGRKQG